MSYLLLVSLAATTGALLATPAIRSLLKCVYFYFIVMFPTYRWDIPNFLAPKIEPQEKILKTRDRTLKPDIYEPTNRHRRRPAVIVYSPLAPDGKRDQVVVRFLRGLARIGFVVVAPYWPARPDGYVDPDDQDELRASLSYLLSRSNVDSKRIGIIAISYGAGPALMVAGDPKLGDKLQYVVTVGGYSDMWSVMRYSTTGIVDMGDKKMQLSPHPFLRYVFLRVLARWAADDNDRVVINQFLNNSKRDSLTNYDQIMPKLSAGGQKILTLLSQPATESLEQWRAQFPAYFRDLVDRFSAMPMVKNIQTKLMLLHSKNDNVVPVSELLQILPEMKREPTISFLNNFDHTIPPPPTPRNFFFVYLPNTLRITSFIYQFIRLQYVQVRS